MHTTDKRSESFINVYKLKVGYYTNVPSIGLKHRLQNFIFFIKYKQYLQIVIRYLMTAPKLLQGCILDHRINIILLKLTVISHLVLEWLDILLGLV